ncbi:PfkB [Penicillium cf. griseofulvum]|nr:PfkB [Penicillium cf. griseofulvum]
MVPQDQQMEVEFCTLGMFIIDEIDFGDSRPGVKNILGGAASFAVVGARLVSGSKYARSVSWIVDVGSDFPVETLDPGMAIILTRNEADFKYLTPKLRLEPEMLSDSQVWSKTFHMVCSPSRCRKAPSAAHASKRPIFVWEPVPDLCTPEEQDKFFAANKVVDVVSPNHMELGMMFNHPGWTEKSQEGQQLVQRIAESGIGPDGTGMLVIRAGKDGSYAYSKSSKIWLPAYHQPDASGATPVIDPTGAGNSFLGALAQGMVTAGREPFEVIDSVLSKSNNWNKALESWGNYQHYPVALICATVAAGFVVEQIGVPHIDANRDGEELWNGTEFTERVRLYTQRLLRTLEESPQRHILVN